MRRHRATAPARGASRPDGPGLLAAPAARRPRPGGTRRGLVVATVVGALVVAAAPGASAAAPAPAALDTPGETAVGPATDTVPVAPDAPVTTTTLDLPATVDTASRSTLSLPVEADPDTVATPGAAAPALAVLTPARTTARFDVVGVTWSAAAAGPDVERVLVRTRHDDAWTGWTELEIDPSVPDAGSREAATRRTGTAPLVRTGSDGLQVRVETATGAAPAGLAATLVDTRAEQLADADVEEHVDPEVGAPTSGRAAAAAVGTSAVARSAATVVSGVSPARLRPAIVTRAQWHADESIRGPIDWSSTIQAVVVHHTVNSNTYTQAQAPALVRGIYEYHVKGRGWSDVGYHFLVDRFGTVYEGRKGSLDAVPLGVHSGGFNTNTIGIAIIGEFTGTVPSSKALTSVAQVAAWKLATFGRDPLGTTVLTARTGSTHPLRKPGWKGSLPVIMGHRDVASTACPGQKVYDRLSTIRSAAAAQVNRVLSTLGTESATPGGTVSARVYNSSDVSWTATVRSVCTGKDVRSLSGSGRGWVTVPWNLRTSDGSAAEPGVYALTTTRHGVRDTVYVEALPRGGYGAEACGVGRWGGADRYETAVALSAARGTTSDDVVIIAGTQASIVDGLVAGPFAASVDAPVLLATASGVPDVTAAEIRRRSPERAWLVGGDGVLGKGVVTALGKLGVKDVRRLGGDTRYDTAAAVAAAMPASSAALLASGEQRSLVDAAAAGGAAAGAQQPVLLTRTSTLPPVTAKALRDRGVRMTSVIGGTGVVTTSVATAVRTATGGKVVRYGGADRYATALATAQAFAPTVGAARVVVAAGEDKHLVDAVAAGALAQLVVVVRGTKGDPAVQDWLRDAGTERLDIAGGTGTVTPSTLHTLMEAL